jgi:hypothetical protein
MTEDERAEHLAFCKRRALEYLDRGDLQNALASMGSDLAKYPETKAHFTLTMLGIRYVLDNDFAAMRRWIEGFR